MSSTQGMRPLYHRYWIAGTLIAVIACSVITGMRVSRPIGEATAGHSAARISPLSVCVAQQLASRSSRQQSISQTFDRAVVSQTIASGDRHAISSLLDEMIAAGVRRWRLEDVIAAGEKAVALGDGRAAFQMGRLYRDGIFGPKNGELAERYFKAALDAGERQAYGELSMLYYKGDLVVGDMAQAREYADKGIAYDDPRSLVVKALILRDNHGSATEVQGLLERAAQANSADALIVLARSANSRTSIPEWQKAVDYARKAADAGSLDAQYLVADLLLSNKKSSDAEQNYAVQLLFSAADAGSPEAQVKAANLILQQHALSSDDMALVRKYATEAWTAGVPGAALVLAYASSNTSETEAMNWLSKGASIDWRARYAQDLLGTDSISISAAISQARLAKIEDMYNRVTQKIPAMSASGAVIQRPSITRFVQPQTPDTFKFLGIQGSVEAELVVTAQGTVNSVSIRSSSHPALDVPTIAALGQWRFKPAVINGVAVPVRMNIPVSYGPL